MVCGTCGATIAEKAIVCYRCGAATALPAAPVRPARAPKPRPWLVIVVLLLVSAVLGWFASVDVAGSLRQVAVIVSASLAAVLAAYLALRRPR